MKKTWIAVVGVLAALVMAIPSFAAPRDVNDDNIPDRWEKRHDLSLKVNQAPRDQDADGLRNMREYREGTDPRAADTDADGETDREECTGKGPKGPGGPTGPPPPPEEETPPPAG